MKRKSYIFCFVAFLICFISAYIFGYYMTVSKESDNYEYNEANVNITTDDNKETERITEKRKSVEITGYWIKTQNEYIVIYNSNGELIANTEISISNFSEKDKQILREGIYIENAEALFRCLESYTS